MLAAAHLRPATPAEPTMSQNSDLWSHDEYAAEEKARATRATHQTLVRGRGSEDFSIIRPNAEKSLAEIRKKLLRGSSFVETKKLAPRI